MDLGAVLGRAFGGGESGVPDDATATKILDAAVAACAAHGISAVTIDGVARRAGVNRVTVYRRFGDRDALLQAMTLREGERMAQGIMAALAGLADPVEQLVEGFAAALRLAEAHPVIRRTAEHEPQDLIAAGLADDAALLRMGSAFAAAGVRRLQADGRATHLDADAVGETMARLFASFVLLPAQHAIDVRTQDGARAYARRTLVPLLLG
ncbi:TetR/AcrR family transcriptional regulator [Nocardioides dokdonensis]|uniref:TetR/AcrR family transcriptional regulator n=1 Tax=Nocardioides dokdonensis TaxID=450734 RepID=UPI000A05A2A9|nr:TetR/AcrR family transcriptional regulator [Nocardioides dokdonensis]